MVERIEGLPENVLGFEAVGKVTSEDYEKTIVPAVEKAVARQGKIRLLYRLGERFEGFEAQAAWDDTVLGLKHLAAWEKVALVSDVEWVRAALMVFAIVVPGPVRLFSNAEYEKAAGWASA